MASLPAQPVQRMPSRPPVVTKEQPRPMRWFTLRRVSEISDVGVSSVPAGTEVVREDGPQGTFILYNGKRYTTKFDDLTSNESLAMEARTKTPSSIPEPMGEEELPMEPVPATYAPMAPMAPRATP